LTEPGHSVIIAQDGPYNGKLKGAEETMARIVVLGGSGQLGTYLVPALIELGYKVVNVSRGTLRRLSPPAGLRCRKL